MDHVSERPYPAGDPVAVYEAFEQAPLFLAALGVPDYRFEATNAAYRAFMGNRDAIGQSAPELFPEILAQQLFGVFDRVVETGQTESISEWRFQFDANDDGVPVEFYVDLVVSQRRGADGAVSGLTFYAMDVTQRVRERQAAQAQAAEAERRYQAARDVVAEVQQELLSTSLPVLPDANVAARYLVASRDQAAGGDWFDAVPLDDGTLALVVGDIVGHGVAASAAMGQMRSVLNEVLTQTGSLEQALSWVDSMASRNPSMRSATLCVVVLEPASGRLRYATCGHPPPLVATSEGATRFLPQTPGGPLGTAASPVTAEATLDAGEVLLLYTDGLVERAGESIDLGMQALASVVGDAVANRVMPVGAPETAPERVCSQGIELMTRLGYDDDVTALAVQRRPEPVQPCFLDLPAEPRQIAVARSTIREWLRPIGVTTRQIQAVDVAVTELLANAVEHAYPSGQPGRVRTILELGRDGRLLVEVADDGTWKEPGEPRSTTGRGLWLAGVMLDELSVAERGTSRSGTSDAKAPHGTVVRLRHRLSRPAVFATEAVSATAPAPRSPFSADLDDGPPRVLRLAGPLDLTTADQLIESLDVATRGGVFPVRIDLADVALLSSAAIRVLFQTRDELAVHGHPLDLVTAEGSPAAQVLDIVGLAHQPTVPAGQR